MQRMNLPAQNENPNFIGCWMIEPLTICDELITYFEDNDKQQRRGITGRGVNLAVKNSVDITKNPSELFLPGNEVFASILNHYLFAIRTMQINGLF